MDSLSDRLNSAFPASKIATSTHQQVKSLRAKKPKKKIREKSKSFDYENQFPKDFQNVVKNKDAGGKPEGEIEINSDTMASRESSEDESFTSSVERESQTTSDHNFFSKISYKAEKEQEASKLEAPLDRGNSETPQVKAERSLSEELLALRMEREAQETLSSKLPHQQDLQKFENRLTRVEEILGITGEITTFNENSCNTFSSRYGTDRFWDSFKNPRSNRSGSRSNDLRGFVDFADPMLNQEDQTHIPKDSYSFIYLCKLQTNPFGFLFGLTVFFFQIGLLMALILPVFHKNLDTHGAIENDKSIFPADVDFIVKFAQWLAMMAFVIFADESMEDILTAVSMLPTRFTAEADENIDGLILSSLLRLTQGTCAVVATFLLIFTSVTSRDVVLNFAAVNFISRLDEIGFALATKGFYVFKTFRQAALEIQIKELPSCIAAKQYPFVQSLAVLVIFVAMTASSVYVFVNQINGNYLDKGNFRINFDRGSPMSKDLQMLYGGCYSYDPNTFSFFSRFFKSEKLTYNHKNVSKFGYCNDERRWSLFDSNYSDACTEEGLLAYSTETTSFEIRQSFGDPWFSNEGMPLDISFRKDDISAENCKAKSNDGKCDIVLNTEGFGWDRGDCCGATCDHPDCGLNTIEKAFDTSLIVRGDGFQHCKNPNMVPITIAIHNITEKVYQKTAFQSVKTKSPRLRVDCGGKNYLTVGLSLAMENKEETIKVKDGTSCKILVRKAERLSEVQYTVYQKCPEHDYGYAIVNADDADLFGRSTFIVLPRCFIENLAPHADFEYIYSNKASPQRKAMDLLLNEINSGQFFCESPFFVERYALLTMLYSLKNFKNESHGPQCSWPAITCDGGKVEEIRLPNNNFSGTLATEIALLQQLRVMVLKQNAIVGTIPTEIGILSKLEHLDLSRNNLIGAIPRELSNLLRLEFIRLYDNKLNGTLPNDWKYLSNLNTISISGNEFSGSIPQALATMTNLEVIDIALIAFVCCVIDDNSFTGTIPLDFDNYHNLTSVELHFNQFTGTICEGKNSSSYDWVSVDCLKVKCTCCKKCTGVPVGCPGLEPDPSGEKVRIRLDIYFDDYPDDTMWRFRQGRKTYGGEGSACEQALPNTLLQWHVHLDPGEVGFILFDDKSDGSGNYIIYAEYQEGIVRLSSGSVPFGSNYYMERFDIPEHYNDSIAG